MRSIFLLSSILLCFQASAQHKANQPKLIVGIVVDQMCYDYLYRYEKKLSNRGFLKLMNNGTACRNAHYNYVPTYTGPGHASIYTGTTPADHGIIANEWYVPQLNKEINCVDDPTAKSVGTDSDEGKCSPVNLKAMTITDQLRFTYPSAKVLSVSIKNRSAILPGGHLANGAYWFDYATGNFVTSSFYRNDLPQWVKEFNSQRKVDDYLKQSWNTLLPIENYTESGPDLSPYEVVPKGKKDPVFPYDLKSMLEAGASKDIFTMTPFANTFLTDFALAGMKAEQLGSDEQTDILAISFSTPDIAGHAFGPYSVEMEDMYLRLDLEIEKLIDVLESQIGKDNFVVFLTADHAVVPVPQQLTDLKLPGGYVYADQLQKKLEENLHPLYGDKLIADISNNQIYLNHTQLEDCQLDASMVAESMRDFLLRQPGIKAVYTRNDLRGVPRDKWMQMVLRGYSEQLSGDVVILLESGYLAKPADNEKAHRGTSHGSAFNYDTQIPLLWYGKQIPVQSIDRHIDITDITATLAIMLRVQRPGLCTGEVITELFKK